MAVLVISDEGCISSSDWEQAVKESCMNNHPIFVTTKIEVAFSLFQTNSIEMLIIDCGHKSMPLLKTFSFLARSEGRMEKFVMCRKIIISNTNDAESVCADISLRPDVLLKRPLKMSDIRKSIISSLNVYIATQAARSSFINDDKDQILSKIAKYLSGQLPLDTKESILSFVFYLEGLAAKGETDRAISIAIKSLEIGLQSQLESSDILNFIARHYIFRKEYVEVVNVIEKYGHLGRNESTTYILAQAFLDLGDTNKANELLGLSESFNELNHQIYFSVKAKAAYKLSKYRESVEAQLKVVSNLNESRSYLGDSGEFKNEFQKLSDYADAYWRSEDDLEQEIIDSIHHNMTKATKNSSGSLNAWLSEHCTEYRIKSAILSGNMSALAKMIAIINKKEPGYWSKNTGVSMIILSNIERYNIGDDAYNAILFNSGLEISEKAVSAIDTETARDKALELFKSAKSLIEKGRINEAENMMRKASYVIINNKTDDINLLVDIILYKIEIKLKIHSITPSDKLIADCFRLMSKIDEHTEYQCDFTRNIRHKKVVVCKEKIKTVSNN